MADTAIEPADLRAAVSAGILTEAQAANIATLAQNRQGQRNAMPAEDEPFEFFRGFAEIFVSVGLLILFAGGAALVSVLAGPLILVLLPALIAAASWWLARYFTLQRRMNLPSMVLAGCYGLGVFTSLGYLMANADMAPKTGLVLAAVGAMAAMGVWYRVFRLPFSMFILGSYGLVAVYALTATFDATRGFGMGLAQGLFDLRGSPQFSLATLLFGMVAFAGGMWFDTRDPHRLGRYSATAFWLHLLAAPALVNTVALTLYNMGGTVGVAATTAALTVIAVLALVIDRRSFLTAGIVYIALVIAWVIRGEGAASLGQWAAILIVLGLFVTALGTWWVPLRASLMRALPAFPGKAQLAPYEATR